MIIVLSFERLYNDYELNFLGDIMTLDRIEIGEGGVITAVNGEGNLRLRLLDMGLIPGTAVQVVKAAPLGDPIEIIIRGYALTIRKSDASMIEVEEESK